MSRATPSRKYPIGKNGFPGGRRRRSWLRSPPDGQWIGAACLDWGCGGRGGPDAATTPSESQIHFVQHQVNFTIPLRGQTLLMASLQNICFQIPFFPSLPKYFLLSVEIRGHQPAWQREMAIGAPNTLFQGQRHLGRKRFHRAEVTFELCMRARDDSKMCR